MRFCGSNCSKLSFNISIANLILVEMSYLIVKSEKRSEVLPVKVFKNPEAARALLQSVRWKILSELGLQPSCARELAKKFKLTDQVVGYHIQRLKDAGFIHMIKSVSKRGAVAKYYAADISALAVMPDFKLGESERIDMESIDKSRRVLDPFLSNGRLNGSIIVGSPDVHGEFKARARDCHQAVDLAMFLGSLLPITRAMVVKLDTELKENELTGNLIAVGGPRANTLTFRVNEKLPIAFQLSVPSAIISKISGKMYNEEDQGIVEAVENPFNPKTRLLVLAGNTSIGTRAAILGFIRYTEKVASGNSFNSERIARVVRGVDLNSDGLVDDVEFLE